MAKEWSYISFNPGMRSGTACLRESGIGADVIAGRWWAGQDVEDICEDYQITRLDILVCCWYQSRYGTRTWRKRWQEWLAIRAVNGADGLLWAGRYEECSMPPQRGKE